MGGDQDEDRPTLGIYLPPADKASGAGVVICPGGGYAHLSMDKEGSEIAAWLNDRGLAGYWRTPRVLRTPAGRAAVALNRSSSILSMR